MLSADAMKLVLLPNGYLFADYSVARSPNADEETKHRAWRKVFEASDMFMNEDAELEEQD